MANEKQLNNSVKQLKRNGRGRDKNGRKMHPNSIKNLKPRWQKGESGNPQGQSITTRQKEMMPDVCPFDSQARIWLDALAEGGMRMALFQSSAMSNLQDRLEGKVTQPVANEGEIILRVKYDDS